jgi:hypothetical protein
MANQDTNVFTERAAMIEALTEGRTYKVTFTSDSGRYERQLTGVFLGGDRWDLAFSLRPVAGTARIPSDHLVDVEAMPDEALVVLPRRVR